MGKRLVALVVATLFGCGARSEPAGAAGESMNGAGRDGQPPAGGQLSAGGLLPSGGQTSAGGLLPAGGHTSSGGLLPAGGQPSTGGQPPAGGQPSTGGQLPVGGQPSNPCQVCFKDRCGDLIAACDSTAECREGLACIADYCENASFQCALACFQSNPPAQGVAFEMIACIVGGCPAGCAGF